MPWKAQPSHPAVVKDRQRRNLRKAISIIIVSTRNIGSIENTKSTGNIRKSIGSIQGVESIITEAEVMRKKRGITPNHPQTEVDSHRGLLLKLSEKKSKEIKRLLSQLLTKGSLRPKDSQQQLPFKHSKAMRDLDSLKCQISSKNTLVQ